MQSPEFLLAKLLMRSVIYQGPSTLLVDHEKLADVERDCHRHAETRIWLGVKMRVPLGILVSLARRAWLKGKRKKLELIWARVGYRRSICHVVETINNLYSDV